MSSVRKALSTRVRRKLDKAQRASGTRRENICEIGGFVLVLFVVAFEQLFRRCLQPFIATEIKRLRRVPSLLRHPNENAADACASAAFSFMYAA
jgi:hypothetical protein